MLPRRRGNATMPFPPHNHQRQQQEQATPCTSLFLELQNLWDEIGETDAQRDETMLQLERECLHVYASKVEQTRMYKADLHQELADAEAQVLSISSALGETDIRGQKPKGTLKEQLAQIKPVLEELRHKIDQRLKEFFDVQIQVSRLSAEIAGNNDHLQNASPPQVDDRDLTLEKMGELKSHLLELQKEKNNRLQKVASYTQLIYDLTTVLSSDFNKTMAGVHPSFITTQTEQTKNISNDSLTRLAGTVCSLEQEKNERLKKLKDLGSTLVELWNLMGTTRDEQDKFNHVTSLISAGHDVVLGPGSLSVDVIGKAEAEVYKLNILKASRMKELVLKKQNELEGIYKSVHMDVGCDATKEMLSNLIDSGTVDLSVLLLSMDDRIAKANEQALSRKDILDKVEKWKFAYREESWLEDYETDQNRYIAVRGAHKNLKRAEKARVLVSKLPPMVDNLTVKVKSWEQERRSPFLYEKKRLIGMLEEYKISRQHREEEKRRYRELKRLQEQLMAEQEVLYGSKPSPLRQQLAVKKPLGQSMNVNMAGGIPGRQASTTPSRTGTLSSSKERKTKTVAVIPENYVALPKDVHPPMHNNSVAGTP